MLGTECNNAWTTGHALTRLTSWRENATMYIKEVSDTKIKLGNRNKKRKQTERSVDEESIGLLAKLMSSCYK